MIGSAWTQESFLEGVRLGFGGRTVCLGHGDLASGWELALQSTLCSMWVVQGNTLPLNSWKERNFLGNCSYVENAVFSASRRLWLGCCHSPVWCAPVLTLSCRPLLWPRNSWEGGREPPAQDRSNGNEAGGRSAPWTGHGHLWAL